MQEDLYINLTQNEGGYDQILEVVDKANPQLAKVLFDKYEADRTAFLQYVKDNTQSHEPRTWAKKSCINCNSCGIIKYLDGKTSICGCSNKNYSKWIKQLRVQFNRMRSRG